jgi:hypothetical protein
MDFDTEDSYLKNSKYSKISKEDSKTENGFIILKRGSDYKNSVFKEKEVGENIENYVDNHENYDIYDSLTVSNNFIAIRDDSLKLNFYQDIQLLCESFLDETILLDNPPLQRCRTHFESLTNEVWRVFEQNYKVVAYTLKEEDDESDNDGFISS